MGKRAREVGAALIIDGTQSVGAMPFDLAAIQPDALVVAAYKWLLGPYSIGAAYFGPRFDGGEPLEENWITRRGSENFRGLVQYVDEYQPAALRYDVGERSNFALMPMLVAALELILKWNPQRIQEYCTALIDEPLERIAGLGFFLEQPEWRGAHSFGIRMPERIRSRDVESTSATAPRVCITARLGTAGFTQRLQRCRRSGRAGRGAGRVMQVGKP